MKSRIITLIIFLFYVSASNAAITFDGVDDYVSIGDKTQLKITGEITISVWVKGNAQQNKGILSKYSATSAQRGYLLASENVANSQKITWYYQRSAGSFNADDTLTTSTNVLDGTWHHIVATFLPSTYARIYVDGILNASDTTTIQSAIVNNTAPVQIGLHDTSTNFNGSIDDVRIYNRALTETEIAILAKSPKRVGGILNLNNNLIAKDSRNSANDGTLMYGPQRETGCPVGNCLKFDGIDDFINVNDSTSLKPNNFTISCWIKLNNNVTGSSVKAIISKVSSNQGYQLIVLGSSIAGQNNELRFDYGDGASYLALDTNESLTPNIWYHVSATLQGNNGELFVNNISKGIKSIAGNISYGTQSLKFGDGFDITNRDFDGSIDDIRIYNKALSPSEISFIYNGSGLDPGTSNLVSHWTLDDVATGLVGHWEMEDKEIGHVAGRAQDETLNANHGSFTNFANLTTAFTSDTSPKSFSPNQSLIFDGVNDYVEFGSSCLDNRTQITVCFWARPRTTTSRIEVAQGTNSTTRTGYGLAEDGNAYILPASTSAYGYCNWSSIGITQFIHYCGVFNGLGSNNAQRAKIFLNGSEKSLSFIGTIPTSIGAFTEPMRLGVRAGLSAFSNGLIDDVRIYDDVLTPAEITYLFSGGTSGTDPGTANLKGYWKLDDSTVQDSTGNNNHGIGLGAPFYSGNAINRN
jgi:hypothetical protein